MELFSKTKLILEAKGSFRDRNEFLRLKFDSDGIFLVAGRVRSEIGRATLRCKESKHVFIGSLIKRWLEFLSSDALDRDKIVALSIFLV